MWNQTLRMNVCVGALAAASVGVGIGSVPISGISLFAGPIAGASGPLTQQQAGSRSSNRRIDAVVVKIAIGFHCTASRMRTDELSRRMPGVACVGIRASG